MSKGLGSSEVSEEFSIETLRSRRVKSGGLLGFRRLIESLKIQRLEENDRIVSRYMDDKDFQDTVFGRLRRRFSRQFRKGGRKGLRRGSLYGLAWLLTKHNAPSI